MNHLRRTSSHQAGFTAVEMLITIVVASVFVLAFYTLYIAVNQSFALSRNRAIANDLAYSYLRKYASAGSTPTWFTCDTAAGSSNTNDATVNAAAAGSIINGDSGTLSTSTTKLPAPITYSVRALAVYGCSGTNQKKPLRIEATITYGPNNTTIKHATFIGNQ